MGKPLALATRLRSLSGKRRTLLAGVALLAAAAVTTAIVAGLRADLPQRSGRPAQDQLGPVLLIPGYGGATASLSALADRIRASGRTAIVLTLPGNGTGSLIADAAVLNAAVSRALDSGAPSVDVIGYSAGGVTALIWARQDDGAAKARHVRRPASS
jgi:triacylglycerol lipase